MIALTTGLLAGILHVLAAPDHLVAIAPLAADTRARSWVTGLFWGAGHTLGLLAVGLAVLILRGLLPVEVLSSLSERLVGVALVLVGLWGLRRSFSHRLHRHEHIHEGVHHSHIHVHGPQARHGTANSHLHKHGAIAIGILHGIAGSAGVFAILPALALPTLTVSMAYLGGFAAGSMATMIAYSWVLGAAFSRLRGLSLRSYRLLLSGVSSTAILVGCLWLAA